jgi:hypothetical protein
MAFHQKSIMDAHCDQAKLCDPTGMHAVSSANSLQTQSTVYLLLGAVGVTTALGFSIAGTSNGASQTSLTAIASPTGTELRLERNF